MTNLTSRKQTFFLNEQAFLIQDVAMSPKEYEVGPATCVCVHCDTGGNKESSTYYVRGAGEQGDQGRAAKAAAVQGRRDRRTQAEELS